MLQNAYCISPLPKVFFLLYFPNIRQLSSPPFNSSSYYTALTLSFSKNSWPLSTNGIFTLMANSILPLSVTVSHVAPSHLPSYSLANKYAKLAAVDGNPHPETALQLLLLATLHFSVFPMQHATQLPVTGLCSAPERSSSAGPAASLENFLEPESCKRFKAPLCLGAIGSHSDKKSGLRSSEMKS